MEMKVYEFATGLLTCKLNACGLELHEPNENLDIENDLKIEVRDEADRKAIERRRRMQKL